MSPAPACCPSITMTTMWRCCPASLAGSRCCARPAPRNARGSPCAVGMPKRERSRLRQRCLSARTRYNDAGFETEARLDTRRYDIDLRSDTVTRPAAGMRAAMAAAEVGDDVYGDDPTVNRLQALMAERFGFESALFFCSGTQSNLAALMAHCGRGDEYLVGQEAHTYSYEQGGAAVLGSIQPQPLENEPDGGISIERIAKAIKPRDIHFAPTRLLALENTIGGRVLPQAYQRQVTEFAHAQGLRTHLDGARIFNAIVKLQIDERAAVAGFDSVSVCLSKGLGAPPGSVLLCSRDVIAQARL